VKTVLLAAQHVPELDLFELFKDLLVFGFGFLLGGVTAFIKIIERVEVVNMP
jgi:hypothetical protein